MRRITAAFLLIAASSFWISPAWAQDDQQRKSDFKSSVERVVLYVAVYDKDGELASGLTRDEFRVFEDKVEQEITSFGIDDVPATIGIVMDSSGSMRGKVDMVNKATERFLDLNHPQNELFLIEFKGEASLEEDFTNDPADIRDALDNIIISGGTALYDAVYLAVEKAAAGREPKKALLVFTDGEDRDSYYEHAELIDKIRETDVQIYVVAFLDQDLSEAKGIFGMFKSEREKVEKEIAAIAEVTGGKTFFPRSINELDAVFTTIAHELRSQYRLAYDPGNKTRDGKWRELDVVVASAKERGLKVRARKGYFAK